MRKYIDETVFKCISELKRQGLLRKNIRTPFQKTEILLYNYNNFKAVIDDKEKQIKEIEWSGIGKRSSDITSFSPGTRYEIKSDADKAEEKIESIEQSIHVTKNFIRIIDAALDSLEDDPYFDIIRMKYFEGSTREEIAEYFDVDASTISRNKNRLINLLQIRLFSDEVIYQMFI